MTVKANFEKIQQDIIESCQRVNRNPNDVQVIAVTKYVSIERAKEALEAGIIHIGENRAEEGIKKRNELQERGTWHFIGSLQSRKVKDVVQHFDFIHSLDRLSLANEIQKRAPYKMNCFVQVNVSGEDSKHGIVPEALLDFISSLKDFSKINVVGLMTMAPFLDNPEDTRLIFRSLKQLQLQVQALQLDYAPCTELSMGMSNDYQVAIEEGATYIRIGTSLVGEINS